MLTQLTVPHARLPPSLLAAPALKRRAAPSANVPKAFAPFRPRPRRGSRRIAFVQSDGRPTAARTSKCLAFGPQLGPLPGRCLKNQRPAQTSRPRAALLLTPREEFVREVNRSHAYDHAFLDIGCGVTISGPHAVPHDQTLEIKAGEKGGNRHGLRLPVRRSLAHITGQGWDQSRSSPLAERTPWRLRRPDRAATPASSRTSTRTGRRLHGWERAGPFDKIIVTCGIDPCRRRCCSR